MTTPTENPLETAAAALDSIATLIGESQAVAPDDKNVLIGLGMNSDAASLRRRAQNLRSGMFNVLVLGEFKNGKSTLLNAMLGQAALPARAQPTTAVVTILVHGPEERIEVFETGSDTPRQIDWSTFERKFTLSDQDAASITQKQPLERFKNIEYVQITQPYPLLTGGIRLIDTPGLSEYISRTRTTLYYLKEAQAIIFVLTAARLLGEREREYIKLLGKGPLEHVFFAVNRINLTDPDEVEEIKHWAQENLKFMFTDDNGQFDQVLYERRVFFVNALGALQARQAGKVDQAKLTESTVPALEQAIEQFLTSTGRVTAALHSTGELLFHIVSDARHRISYKQAVLSLPVERLQQNKQKAEQKLKELEPAKQKLKKTFTNTGRTIANKVYGDLLSYPNEMRKSWPEDGPKYIDMEDVSFTEILQLSTSKKQREALAAKFKPKLQEYLRIKLQQWAEGVPTLIAPESSYLDAQIQEQIEAFQLELAQVENIFAGKEDEPTGSTSARTMQLIQRALQGATPDQFMESLLGEGAWHDQILRFLPALIIALLIAFPLGGLLLAGAGILELLNAYSISEELKKRMLAELGKRLLEKLEQEISDQKKTIYANIEQEFAHLADSFDQTLQEQIDQIRRRQEAIMRQRRDHSFLYKQEQNQLATLEEKLLAYFDQISQLAYQRSFTPEEIDERAAWKELLTDLDSKEAWQHQVDAVEKEFEATLEKETTGVEVATPEDYSTDVSDRIRSLLERVLSLDPSTQEGSHTRINEISEDLAALIGLHEVKEKILALSDYVAEEKRRQAKGLGNQKNNPSLHLVFTGNPGTGKTTVARILGRIYYHIGITKKEDIKEAGVTDLVALYVGHTPDLTKKTIENAFGGILFIDEAYRLVEEGRGGYGQEAVDVLLEYMENYRDKLIVIVAGYPDKMEKFLTSNPGLARRFPLNNRIHFPDYKPDELMCILEKMLRDDDFEISTEAKKALYKVVEGLYATRDNTFGNAGEVRNLAEALKYHRASRVQREDLHVEAPICPADIPRVYDRFVHISVEDPEEILKELDALVGLEDVKAFVRRLVRRLQYERQYQTESRPQAAHMVFTGNPGTGKTTVARLMGRIFKALGYLRTDTLIETSRGDLVGVHIGETAQILRKQIRRALEGILFIDEAYSLIPAGNMDRDFGQEAISELVKAMEDFRDRIVIIVAGYPNEMTRFFDSNPGLNARFPLQIHFPDYSTDELIQILKRQIVETGKFTLSGAAEVRAEAYLEYRRRQTTRTFGNAREVRNLLDAMKSRLAERIIVMPPGPERDRFAYRFEAIDIPEIPDEAETNVSEQILIKEGKIESRVVPSSDVKLGWLIPPPETERPR